MDLYALIAGIRKPAGSCPLFPVDLPLEVETWESGRRLHAALPAVFPEPLNLHDRELCKRLVDLAGYLWRIQFGIW